MGRALVSRLASRLHFIGRRHLSEKWLSLGTSARITIDHAAAANGVEGHLPDANPPESADD